MHQAVERILEKLVVREMIGINLKEEFVTNGMFGIILVRYG